MKYDKMTNDEFDAYLSEIIDNEYSIGPSCLLQVPGIYEILSEHFNNEVLERWEDDHPDDDEDEDDDDE